MKAAVKTYWFVLETQTEHREKARSLEKLGLTVQFCNPTLEQLRIARTERSSYIFIDAEMPDFIGVLETLAIDPALAGSKIIVITKANTISEKLMFAAAWSTRDCIRIDLHEPIFLERVARSLNLNSQLQKYQDTFVRSPDSSGGTAQKLFLLAELSANLYFSGRVIWFNNEYIAIETKLKVEPGRRIKFNGSLVNKILPTGLEVEVVENFNTPLRFRFSNGFVAKWTTDTEGHKFINSEIFLKQFPEDLSVYRPRVFILAKNNSLRQTMIDFIEKQNFDIQTALQKSTVNSTVSYFQPNILIVEDEVCLPDNPLYSTIQQIVETLDPEAHVVVMGNLIAQDMLDGLFKRRVLLANHQNAGELNQFASWLSHVKIKQDKAFEKYGEGTYVRLRSAFSICEVTWPAKITHINLHSAHLFSNIKIPPYALMRAELLPDNPQSAGEIIWFKAFGQRKRTLNGEEFPTLDSHAYVSQMSTAMESALKRAIMSELATLAIQYPETSSIIYKRSGRQMKIEGRAAAAGLNGLNAEKDATKSDYDTSSDDGEKNIAARAIVKKEDEDYVIYRKPRSMIKRHKLINSNLSIQEQLKIVGYVAVAVVASYLIYLGARSIGIENLSIGMGDEYVDSLKKFAPKKFNNSK